MEIVRQRTIDGESVKTIEFIPEVRDHGFAKVFQTMSRKVLTDLKGALNGATEVLWFFIDQVIASEAYHENPRIYAPTDEIMKQTGQQRSAVYKHLKILVELHYIIKLRPHLYQVNPEFLFVGRAQPRVRAQMEFDELTRQTEAAPPKPVELAPVIEPVPPLPVKTAPRRQRSRMHKRAASR